MAFGADVTLTDGTALRQLGLSIFLFRDVILDGISEEQDKGLFIHTRIDHFHRLGAILIAIHFILLDQIMNHHPVSGLGVIFHNGLVQIHCKLRNQIHKILAKSQILALYHQAVDKHADVVLLSVPDLFGILPVIFQVRKSHHRIRFQILLQNHRECFKQVDFHQFFFDKELIAALGQKSRQQFGFRHTFHVAAENILLFRNISAGINQIIENPLFQLSCLNAKSLAGIPQIPHLTQAAMEVGTHAKQHFFIIFAFRKSLAHQLQQSILRFFHNTGFHPAFQKFRAKADQISWLQLLATDHPKPLVGFLIKAPDDQIFQTLSPVGTGDHANLQILQEQIQLLHLICIVIKFQKLHADVFFHILGQKIRLQKAPEAWLIFFRNKKVILILEAAIEVKTNSILYQPSDLHRQTLCLEHILRFIGNPFHIAIAFPVLGNQYIVRNVNRYISHPILYGIGKFLFIIGICHHDSLNGLVFQTNPFGEKHFRQSLRQLRCNPLRRQIFCVKIRKIRGNMARQQLFGNKIAHLGSISLIHLGISVTVCRHISI